MDRLKGKVTIISGAGSGIGRAAAILFAFEGAAVVIAERDSGSGQETAQEIRASGGRSLFVETDVTDEESVRACVSAAVQEYGRVTNLYNNAGGSTSRDGPLTEAPIEEFWRAMKLEVLGTWLMSRHCIPEIARAGGGAVVNASSTSAIVGAAGRDAYTAAKGAITALTRSMAVEFAPLKIRVNAIAPGLTLTNRVRDQLSGLESIEQVEKKHLLGIAQPIDQAYAALYLLSDEARVTTGHVLVVDSGYTIW
jgi:NAD(P)-dependent dehydrogenase (short-subunit alcohol dehydrogenase family)